MKLYTAVVLLTYLGVCHCYTKYGRSCKDIGCPSNQQCVMETDPCSYYQRQGECGSYPTCKKSNSNTARTCSTYVCPPTKVCKMDEGTPKCVDDHSKVGHVGYDTQNQNNLGSGSAANSGGSGQMYPSLSRGETTARPNINYQPVGGSGYQGGSVGSGYPGQQAGGYPQRTGGYPQQPGGYPQQAGAYPQQPGGYPNQRGGYPQGGYPQGGYPGYQGGSQQGGYSNQYPGGYYQQNGYNNQRYGSNSSPSFSDQISNSLKSIGGFFKNLGKSIGL